MTEGGLQKTDEKTGSSGNWYFYLLFSNFCFLTSVLCFLTSDL
jgi:hypothetical protein